MSYRILKMRLQFLAPLFVLLQSCETNPSISPDYFPVHNKSQWRFERTMPIPEGPAWVLDTLTLHVAGEVIVDGHTYHNLIGTDLLDKLFRKEGSKYYARQHDLYKSDFGNEYLFLDTSLPEGASWSYIKDGGAKTEYVIRKKNASHILSGVKYKNVIEVQTNYYFKELDDYKLWVTAEHYYAPGVGEIYSHYPYPISMRYGDIDMALIPMGTN